MKKACRLLCLLTLIFCVVLSSSSCNTSDANNSKKGTYIREIVTNSSGVEFVVLSVTDTSKIGYTTTENNFIVVTIKISNKGKDPWSQNPNNCKLKINGAEYEYSSATYSLENSMSGLSEINPNISKTMQIAFETPTKSSVEQYSIELRNYSLWSEDSVTIILADRPEN